MDPKAGIFYGVAAGPEIPSWFWEEAEAHYSPCCGFCGADLPEDWEDSLVWKDQRYQCPTCEKWFEDYDAYRDEPDGWTLDTEGFSAHSTDGLYVFITKSPNVVQCRECSPCFPCAGDLGTAGEGNRPTYGFPEE